MIKLWHFFLKDNELIKKLELLSFFYNFEIYERYVFIVCEVEILILIKETVEEYKCIDFFDYIDHVKFGQDEVLVYLVDGSIENVSI